MGVGWHRIMHLVRAEAERVAERPPGPAGSGVVGGRDIDWSHRGPASRGRRWRRPDRPSLVSLRERLLGAGRGGLHAQGESYGGALSGCRRYLDVAAVGAGYLRGLGQAQARPLVVALPGGVERRHGILQHFRSHTAAFVFDDHIDPVSVGLDGHGDRCVGPPTGGHGFEGVLDQAHDRQCQAFGDGQTFRISRVLPHVYQGLPTAVGDVGILRGPHSLPHQPVQVDLLPRAFDVSEVDHALYYPVGPAQVPPDVVHVGPDFLADPLDLVIIPVVTAQSLHKFIQEFCRSVGEVGYEIQRVPDLMGHPGGQIDHLPQLLLGNQLVLRLAELGQSPIQFQVPGFQVGVGCGQLGTEPLHELQPHDLDRTEPQRLQRFASPGDFVVAPRLDAVVEVTHAEASDPDLNLHGTQTHPDNQDRHDPDDDHRRGRQRYQYRIARPDCGDGQRRQQNVDQHDQNEVLDRVAPDGEPGHPEGVVDFNPLFRRVSLIGHSVVPLFRKGFVCASRVPSGRNRDHNPVLVHSR